MLEAMLQIQYVPDIYMIGRPGDSVTLTNVRDKKNILCVFRTVLFI
jgi:hypothetical protein